MTRKSRVLLGLATAAMVVALATRFISVPSAGDVGDFATGLGVALLIGVLIGARADRVPPARSDC